MEDTQNSGLDSDETGNQNLYLENERLRATNQMLWSLLADISKKMQSSSAAIKASVSSLLGYDIVLGMAAQHELLEIIESSTDQVSKNIMLLTLVSKMASDTFIINPEPTEVPEILSAVIGTVAKTYPDLPFDLTVRTPGKPAYVDYEYLSIALVMLCELMIQMQPSPRPLGIAAVESKDHWAVDIGEVNQEVLGTLLKASAGGSDELLQDAHLLPTRRLQLYVVYRILERLSIKISTPSSNTNEPVNIRLMVPVVDIN